MVIFSRVSLEHSRNTLPVVQFLRFTFLFRSSFGFGDVAPQSVFPFDVYSAPTPHPPAPIIMTTSPISIASVSLAPRLTSCWSLPFFFSFNALHLPPRSPFSFWSKIADYAVLCNRLLLVKLDSPLSISASRSHCATLLQFPPTYSVFNKDFCMLLSLCSSCISSQIEPLGSRAPAVFNFSNYSDSFSPGRTHAPVVL